MEKTFSCRIDEDIHAKIKAKLVSEGISLQEWLTSKILEDIEVKTDDSATKISDFHDKFVRAAPNFFAKRSVWIGYMGTNVVHDKEATKEFESIMRRILGDWNSIFGMKDNAVRLKMFVENPQSVRFMS